MEGEGGTVLSPNHLKGVPPPPRGAELLKGALVKQGGGGAIAPPALCTSPYSTERPPWDCVPTP